MDDKTRIFLREFDAMPDSVMGPERIRRVAEACEITYEEAVVILNAHFRENLGEGYDVP